MKGKYDYNPLYVFYDELNTAISEYINNDFDNYECMDDLAKNILLNNGCAFSNTPITKTVSLLNNNYILYFVIGGTGNATTSGLYDYMNINGLDYFVIFLNSFNNIDEIIPDDDELKVSIGKSIYFDYICKLVNVYIATTVNQSVFMQLLSTSSISNNYRYAPYIIASQIIYNINGKLSSDDVSMMRYDKLLDIVQNNKIVLALYGIRYN